jgi:hypothetical protein
LLKSMSQQQIIINMNSSNELNNRLTKLIQKSKYAYM